jgi:hypothetical protein
MSEGKCYGLGERRTSVREGSYLLGHTTVQSVETEPIFLTTMLPESSELKNKPRKRLA